MRSIFLLLFILAFLIPSMAQEKENENSRPTQQQIQAQKQEALSKAKNQREVTRQKLADAKASNENPEKIKQMEKMLATMDQMIAMLEKTDLSGKTPNNLPPPENKEPVYVSPFTPIKLNQPVKTPTWDQAKDKLLWYSGRRIDANTLITPSGLIVQYDRQLSTIILQPPRSGPNPDTMYYGLVNTLNQLRSMGHDYAARMGSMLNSYFMYSEIELTYKEYDLFKNNYYELAKNKRQIPSLNGSLESMIQSLANLFQNLQPVQIVVPAKRPNDLCLCEDASARASYHDNLKAWVDQFYGEEEQILGTLMRIYEKIESLNFLGRAIPSIASSVNDPIQYYQIVLERMTAKLRALSRKYEQGDVLIEDGMVHATLYLLKRQTDLGFDSYSSTRIQATRHAIERVVKDVGTLLASPIFEQYIQDQKSDLAYNSVFDYSLYMAHELNRKLANPSYEVNPNLFQKWMEGLKKFNRFELIIDLDFHYQLGSETGEVTMWANGQLKNEGKIYVSLGRRDCHWELFLTDVNHGNLETSGEEVRIPLKVINAEKDYINDRKPPFRYSGPSLIKMVFPDYRLNFCSGQSTVKIDVASFSSTDAKRHENDDVKLMYTSDILAYVNKVVLGVAKTEVNMDQLISTAGEMMNINSSQLPQSTGDPTLDKLKMAYMMNKKKYELQLNLANATHHAGTIISIPSYQPGSVNLLDITHDTADPEDEDRKRGIMLTKGIIRLKVKHAPY